MLCLRQATLGSGALRSGRSRTEPQEDRPQQTPIHGVVHGTPQGAAQHRHQDIHAKTHIGANQIVSGADQRIQDRRVKR